MSKSPKAESNDQSGKYATLIQQFKSLELEWRSLQKSMSRSNPLTLSSDNSILTSFDQVLLEKSPRSPVSTLQPNLLLRVKNSSCDMAVEEILCDRRAAIMSGKIKGRRLFQPVAAGGQISSDLLDMSQQRDENICSFSDNSLLAGEKAVVVEKSGRGEGYVVSMAWFAFVLILVTLGLISISCNGKFVQENEFILVPT